MHCTDALPKDRNFSDFFGRARKNFRSPPETIIRNYTLARMRLQKLMSRLTTIKNDINGSYNFKRRFFFSCAVHMKLIHGKGMKGIQGDNSCEWTLSNQINVLSNTSIVLNLFSFSPPVGPGLDNILSVPVGSYKATKRCFC